MDEKLVKASVRGKGDSGYANATGLLLKASQGDETSPKERQSEAGAKTGW